MDNKQLYAMIEEQENLLQFSEFTGETALKIGLMLVEKAKRNGKAIVIDIERHNQKLFHYAFDGTSPDNDFWIAGKNSLVNRFNHSSLYMAKKIREKNSPAGHELGVYIAGGAFPIIIKDVGVIGTITVSGLSEEEDHGYVAEVLKEYLGK
jgi:uncharacterized protein (UPF0303 family)